MRCGYRSRSTSSAIREALLWRDARTRAGSQPILADEEELLERANRREVASIVIGSLGGALVITGIVLASVGGSRRAAVRREAEQARFGWGPRGLTLRF